MKILFKTQFGSHLYGTNGPTSDLDFKGVYIATLEEIILKKDRRVVINNKKVTDGKRNSTGDVDSEFKELREFLKEAMEGQTYALDMIFSSPELWMIKSPEWEFIVKNKEKLLSRNVKPFLGYIRQQTAKYGLKGARLAELQRVLIYYENLPEKDLIQDHPAPELSEFVRVWESANERPHGLPPIYEKYLEVLGKKFQFKTQIKNVIQPLRKFDEEYGKRSRMAATNEGVDWKAVSHAFRLCYQLVELSNNHKFTFPLPEREYIKQIKSGQISWLSLQDELSKLMDQAFDAIGKSSLPEEPNRKFWEEWMVQVYLAHVKGSKPKPPSPESEG